MDYATYSLDITRQIFGDMNFRKMGLMLPLIFISDVDQMLTVNPEAVEFFTEDPTKLRAIVQAVKEDQVPPIVLVGSCKDIVFYDDVRRENITAPGFVYYASKDVLQEYAKAA